MEKRIRIILAGMLMLTSMLSFAYIAPDHNAPGVKDKPISFRNDCAPATMSYDLAINNVRARLLNGGDMWWDLKIGQYIVPKVDPALGVPGVSSLFAGAVWLGGFDDAGNLKIAAQTYRTPPTNPNDFWPGPLSTIGTTGADTCLNWDRFFIVKGVTIERHIQAFKAAELGGFPFDCESVSDELKKYPARGNPYWSNFYEFDLPNDTQGLGAFFDADGDNIYDPCAGDYPAIEVRGCPTESNFPDEIVFWVYNDAGNVHTNTSGKPIRMEVQVQAFAYATNDQINDMTFYRYKLINRATSSIDSTYFGMWVDPDLGCSADDFVGCDTSRSMMYVYNQDETDGNVGCDCSAGAGATTTYCNDVPILGVDYFRGPRKPVRGIDTFRIADLPLDKLLYPNVPYDTIERIGDSLIVFDIDMLVELGMSSFTYHVRGDAGNWPSAMWDPQTDIEFYRYLSGSWRDGSPYTFGGTGYNIGATERLKYSFTGDPNNTVDWSMCSAGFQQEMDPRTVQATGPFRLDPGAINELIIGVVWVPDQIYPCPDLGELRAADDLAQALFNNCFILPKGPDAPDLDWIELDRELIMVLSNDSNSLLTNNANELYRERGLEIPEKTIDSNYVFEGYKVYQLINGNVTLGDLEDVTKARLIFQVDKNNGIDRLFNWSTVKGPNEVDVWVPVEQVNGEDNGIRHTFRITEDQFASGDRRLVNHKHYYYTAIAYAFNEFEPFDPSNVTGQRAPYLEGRRNIKTYDPLPHPQTFREINGLYGEGSVVTRLEGVGAGENFLELGEGELEEILSGNNHGEVTYAPGAAPIRVSVFNPLVVTDGEYILEFTDPSPTDTVHLSPAAGWKFYNVANPSKVYTNEKPLSQLNEQLIADLGISVFIGQSDDAGDKADKTNGTIGYSLEYKDVSKPSWLTFLGDDFAGAPIFNFVQTELPLPTYPNYIKDPNRAFSTFAPWVPFVLTDFMEAEPAENPLGWNITPMWLDGAGGSVSSEQFGGTLQNLNNVDIIITSDTSKWSRCAVVETSNAYYTSTVEPGIGLASEGNKKSFQARSRLSVGKRDNDGDGFPDPDGAKDAAGAPLTGMGWFPGYAVDVETGIRVNIFFGENSTYSDFVAEALQVGNIGFDMIWNPGPDIIVNSGGGNISPLETFVGGQQYVYVMRTAYDGCTALRKDLDRTGIIKARTLAKITWTAIPLLVNDPTVSLLPLNEGLIPNDVTIKLRVDNPYQLAVGNGQHNRYPTYSVKFNGVTSSPIVEAKIPEALAEITVVPNPYLAFSDYETSSFDNTVKITNLPGFCTVTIYSLDGRFIRQYERNEVGKPNSPPRTSPPVAVNQIEPDLEWNLKNFAGIPIASGVYLIHINAPGLGERVVKWFGISRQFDPSGL
ncbi:MAG TPA: hypothetical protein VFG10_00630 [Saprospiraceae bacterium]|nr:hypothetical protein [Saprospiraceae bacterium]